MIYKRQVSYEIARINVNGNMFWFLLDDLVAVENGNGICHILKSDQLRGINAERLRHWNFLLYDRIDRSRLVTQVDRDELESSANALLHNS